jgi:hypothetical protein
LYENAFSVVDDTASDLDGQLVIAGEQLGVTELRFAREQCEQRRRVGSGDVRDRS